MKNIELYPHNQKTYEKIKEMWKTTNRVAAIQATGTGKSYLILKCLSDVLDEKKIVLAPSSYILEQLVKEAGEEIPNTTLMTYMDLSFDTEKKLEGLNPTLICLDEFHRCGAEQWGLGVQTLLEMYPNAKVLGTSATHIRFLDGSRDMSDELFEGNIAVNLSLSEAIVKEILPTPKYVSALYTFDEEVDNLKNKVESSKNDEESKKELLKEIDLMKNKLDKSKGIPKILKKHLEVKNGKFVVFCKDSKHLNEMKEVVADWFKASKITKKVDVYSIYSEYENSNEELDQFKNNKSEDSTKLLFTINMFNEGIHIKDVDGVILLRPTSSPIIYYQQIGRAMQVKDSGNPLILDFVNNFDNIGVSGFTSDLEDQIEKVVKEDNDIPKTKGRLGKLLEFMVFDETLEVRDLFTSIEDRLIDDWDDLYSKLKDYKEKFGDCKVEESHEQLGYWVSKQRAYAKLNRVSVDRKKKLDDLSFIWDVNEYMWDKKFQELKEYRDIYGDCNVPYTDVKNKELHAWVSKNRTDYRIKRISKDRVDKLNSIGFAWKANSYRDTKGVKCVKGVAWNKNKRRWTALITKDKEREYLGSSTDRLDAIKLRRDAEIKYFGKSDINLDDYKEEKVS